MTVYVADVWFILSSLENQWGLLINWWISWLTQRAMLRFWNSFDYEDPDWISETLVRQSTEQTGDSVWALKSLCINPAGLDPQ